jgi:catalase (peroxidase I)
MSDAESFAVREPMHDGLRNWVQAANLGKPEALLLDRAQDDNREKLCRDLVAAWTQVRNADRF